MFTGEYRHSIDDKGRVAVPIRFRDDLAPGAIVSKWIDACLAIHPKAEWDSLAARAAALPITDRGARLLRRFVFGQAYEFTPDKQGRLVLPEPLRDYAGLGKAGKVEHVVVVGSGERIELWAVDRWAAYSAEMDSPEVLAEHLQGLGI